LSKVKKHPGVCSIQIEEFSQVQARGEIERAFREQRDLELNLSFNQIRPLYQARSKPGCSKTSHFDLQLIGNTIFSLPTSSKKRLEEATIAAFGISPFPKNPRFTLEIGDRTYWLNKRQARLLDLNEEYHKTSYLPKKERKREQKRILKEMKHPVKLRKLKKP